MEAIQALHAKIVQLEQDIRSAEERSHELDDKIEGLLEIHESNLERQQIAKNAIVRNRALIEEKEKCLVSLQVKSERDMLFIEILQYQLQHIAQTAASAAKTFGIFSEFTNKSLANMLEDLNGHNFYEQDESFTKVVENMRAEWREYFNICSFYWKDEEDMLREKFQHEKEKIASVLEHLKILHERIASKKVSIDGSRLVRPNVVEPISDQIRSSDIIIDVTDTYSAVIDLDTTNHSRELAGPEVQVPWYHEYKRRKVIHQNVVERESDDSGFVSGWERFSRG